MVSVPSAILRWRKRIGCAGLSLGLALFALPAAPTAQDTTPPPQQVPPQQQPDWSGDVPAHLAVIDGTVNLERDGTIEAAQENSPLLAGDRLRTDDGRAEIMFADGSVLDIDQSASLDLLSDSLVRLQSGRVRLSISRVTEALAYRIDAVGTTTTIKTAGEYRLSVNAPKSTEPTVDLAVIRGTAELSTDSGRTLVRAGMRAFASEHTEPSLPTAFNSTSETAFDRWCDDLRDARLGAVSSQYLPSELRYYSGALDREGDWRYDAGAGYVWYPHVAATWQPYYYGNWAVVGSFGWFWVGAGSWCWPTHHYGYWGYNNGWYWAPGHVWSPAWVSWSYAPGYVRWCPIGYGGYPVVVHGHGYGYGWTTVPARTFTTGFAVPRHAVTTTVAGNFTSRASAPTVPVARSRTGAGAGARTGVEPLRSPTARSMAISRNGDARTPADPGRVGSSRPSSDVSRGTTSTGPRATLRSGPSGSEPVTGPSVSRSRVPSQPSTPRSELSPADRAPMARSRVPQIPRTTDQSPISRAPADAARSRVWSSSRPPADPAPLSSAPSRAYGRSPVSPMPERQPEMSSPGARRITPPSSSRGPEGPVSGPPPVSRAMPRSMPSGPPPSSAAHPSSPRTQGGPPASGSSGRSSSGSGPSGGGGSHRGRGGR